MARKTRYNGRQDPKPARRRQPKESWSFPDTGVEILLGPDDRGGGEEQQNDIQVAASRGIRGLSIGDSLMGASANLTRQEVSKPTIPKNARIRPDRRQIWPSQANVGRTQGKVGSFEAKSGQFETSWVETSHELSKRSEV